MKIREYTWRHRFDFRAIYECEHCAAIDDKRGYGYDDDNYHVNVIPRMHCMMCGKNRAGELEK